MTHKGSIFGPKGEELQIAQSFIIKIKNVEIDIDIFSIKFSINSYWSDT